MKLNYEGLCSLCYRVFGAGAALQRAGGVSYHAANNSSRLVQHNFLVSRSREAQNTGLFIAVHWLILNIFNLLLSILCIEY